MAYSFTSVGFALFWIINEFVPVSATVCAYTDVFHTKYTYCPQRCCGSYHNTQCCSYVYLSTGSITGLVIGVSVVVGAVIGYGVFRKTTMRKRRVVIAPGRNKINVNTVCTPSTSGTSTHVSMTQVPAPPPYPGAYGQPSSFPTAYPPSYTAPTNPAYPPAVPAYPTPPSYGNSGGYM